MIKSLKKPLSILLALTLMVPMPTGAETSPDCEHIHGSDCAYLEAAPCAHTHDADCGFSAGGEGAPCQFVHAHDGVCGYDGADAETCAFDLSAHIHDAACGYQSPVPASPCAHTHDEACGHAENMPCDHAHDEHCGELPPAPPALDPEVHIHDAACGHEAPVPPSPCAHAHDEACVYAEDGSCGHGHDESCGGLPPASAGEAIAPAVAPAEPAAAMMAAAGCTIHVFNQIGRDEVHTCIYCGVQQPHIWSNTIFGIHYCQVLVEVHELTPDGKPNSYLWTCNMDEPHVWSSFDEGEGDHICRICGGQPLFFNPDSYHDYVRQPSRAPEYCVNSMMPPGGVYDRCKYCGKEVLVSISTPAYLPCSENVWRLVRERTCTTGSTYRRICNRAGDHTHIIFDDSGNLIEETVDDALGHLVDETSVKTDNGRWHLCNRCNQRLDHVFEPSHNPGYHKCRDCGFLAPHGMGYLDGDTHGCGCGMTQNHDWKRDDSSHYCEGCSYRAAHDFDSEYTNADTHRCAFNQCRFTQPHTLQNDAADSINHFCGTATCKYKVAHTIALNDSVHYCTVPGCGFTKPHAFSHDDATHTCTYSACRYTKAHTISADETGHRCTVAGCSFAKAHTFANLDGASHICTFAACKYVQTHAIAQNETNHYCTVAGCGYSALHTIQSDETNHWCADARCAFTVAHTIDFDTQNHACADTRCGYLEAHSISYTPLRHACVDIRCGYIAPHVMAKDESAHWCTDSRCGYSDLHVIDYDNTAHFCANLQCLEIGMLFSHSIASDADTHYCTEPLCGFRKSHGFVSASEDGRLNDHFVICTWLGCDLRVYHAYTWDEGTHYCAEGCAYSNPHTIRRDDTEHWCDDPQCGFREAHRMIPHEDNNYHICAICRHDELHTIGYNATNHFCTFGCGYSEAHTMVQNVCTDTRCGYTTGAPASHYLTTIDVPLVNGNDPAYAPVNPPPTEQGATIALPPIMAKPGFTFDKWSVTGGNVTINNATSSSDASFTMGTDDVTVSALFIATPLNFESRILPDAILGRWYYTSIDNPTNGSGFYTFSCAALPTDLTFFAHGTMNGLMNTLLDAVDIPIHVVDNITGEAADATYTLSVVEAGPEIAIGTQPAANTTVIQGEITGTLSVAASATLGATLSYQWYGNTAKSNQGGTSLGAANGADTATLTIPTSLMASGSPYYYYCVVSATDGASPVKSGVATVTVNRKTVSVGMQRGTLLAGKGGTATFPVVTAHIPDGEYAVSVANLPGGVSVAGRVTVNRDAGTLTLAGGTSAIGGQVKTLTLTLGGATSEAFALVVASLPPTVSGVAVAPAFATVQKGSTRQFTATVNGANGPAQTVTWSVEGNNSAGTALVNGLLTVAANETATTLTVRATSTANIAVSGAAAVTVVPPPPAVTGVAIDPASATIQKGGLRQFAATVNGTNGPAQTVTWSVEGNNNAGTVIIGGLLFVTANETATALTVRATSTANNAVSATAAVMVVPPPPVVMGVTVDPASATVQKGGTRLFAATVSGTNSPAQTVTWSVEGNNSADTTIVNGLLTVAGDETATALTVRATSAANVSVFDTAAVTVTDTPPAPVYGIWLSNADHTFAAAEAGYGVQQALAVTVSNTGNQPTGTLSVALGGAYPDAFEVSTLSINSMAVSGSADFRVAPKTGLAPGVTYTARVTVSGANITARSFNVSFTVNSAPAATYFLTVVNGTDNTNAGPYAAGTQVSISAATAPSGQVFDRWTGGDGGSFADPAGAATTFTMPANAATVTAVYKSGGGTQENEKGEEKADPQEWTVENKTKPDAKGRLRIIIDEPDVSGAISDAIAKGEWKNQTENGMALVFEYAYKWTNELSVTITARALARLQAEGAQMLTVRTTKFWFGFDLAAVASLIEQSGGADIIVTVTGANGLTGDAKTRVGKRPAYAVAVTYAGVEANGQGGAPETIRSVVGLMTRGIAYSRAHSEYIARIGAVYAEKDGSVRAVERSAFAKGWVTWADSVCSAVCAVGYQK